MISRILALVGVSTPFACFSPPGVTPDGSSTGPASDASTAAPLTDTGDPPTGTTAAPVTSTGPTPETSAAPTTDATTSSTGPVDPSVGTSTGTDTTDATSDTTVTAPECGNGVIEGDEACDDANADDTDDCLATCVVATCGDGIVHAGVEACDDANVDNTDACLSTCMAATCGDGFLQAGVEACDDGNLANNDACLSSCANNPCGNGIQQDAEQCDDGAWIDGDGCSSECKRDAAFVFISDALFMGSQNGNAFGYATDLCNDAEKAKLEATLPGAQGLGTFAPWMSTDVKSPATHFLQSTKPYIRPDGVKIADNYLDLVDGSLLNPIRVTSTKAFLTLAGNPCDNGNLAWTGTSPAGSTLADRCNDWAGNAFNGMVGSGRATDGDWSQCSPKSCIGSYRVFCFEQLM